MQNIRNAFWFFLWLLMPTFVGAQNNVIDEIIAVVGGKPILKSDVEQTYLQFQVEGLSFQGDAKCRIFEDLLKQKLMLNQAELDSIEVSENMVVRQVDSRMNFFIQQIGSREKVEEYFKKSSLELKNDMKEMIRNQMLTQQMQAEITKDVTVTPAEVRDFFSQMPKDSIPFVEEQFEVEQIVVYPKIDEAEVERVKDRLRDFQKRIREGQDFATLAVLYSEDKGSARRGGELGYNGRGQLVPEFANVAFNLTDPKRVSKIVQSEYGFHIIQLIDRKGDRLNCRHILLKPKVSDDSRKEAGVRLDSIADFIRKEKFTFNQAAFNFSYDKDTRNNGGVMVNPMTGDSKFELTQLPPDVAKKVEHMKIGEITDPFKMIDPRKDKEIYLIVRVKNRIKPHKANLKEDYQLLKERMLVYKKDQEIEKWIKEKQKDTYIHIVKHWGNCDFKYKGWVK